MQNTKAMESLRGHLLVAAPSLLDPNFHRSVVLLGDHGEEGALGVILNRPSDLRVSEAVPPLGRFTDADAPVFLGGPVRPTELVVVADVAPPVEPDVPVLDSIGFLSGDIDPRIAENVRRARVFAGYAGWEQGQLEAELEEAAWFVEPAMAEDVFAERPEDLWAAVLRRMGGRYAFIATMPPDPSMN